MLERVWRKGNLPTLLVRMEIGTTTMENSMEKHLRKLNIELTHDPVISLLGIYMDKTFLEKDICTHMFISVLFTLAKTWKQPKCPSTDEWIKKMWYTYTTEYYSAIKKNKIMSFAATWMELETVILSEVRKRKTNIIQ